jgi:hypothetical protein
MPAPHRQTRLRDRMPSSWTPYGRS